MASDVAKVYKSGGEIRVHLPMTQPTGKIRIKTRSFFGEYGMPVASRSSAINLNCYVEWQIGYDLLYSKENLLMTSLGDFPFQNNKGEKKIAYELSEIVYLSYKTGLIKLDDIKEVYDYISSLDSSSLLDVIDSMRITRTNPIETKINDMDFFEMKVSYPLVVHKFGKYDIYAEVTNREKQRGVGVQPMLYVCLPITSLKFVANPLGRTLNAKESADWVIGSEEAKLSLELFKIFGMLSAKHRYDVIAILKALFTI